MPSQKPELHYRRCHVCGGVNQAEGQNVTHCLECGKALAPFFYFDEAQIQPLNDTSQLGPCTNACTNPHKHSGYAPLIGLTALW